MLLDTLDTPGSASFHQAVVFYLQVWHYHGAPSLLIEHGDLEKCNLLILQTYSSCCRVL